MADLEELRLKVSTSSDEAVRPIENLATALGKLKSNANVTGLKTTATGIESVAVAVNKISTSNISNLNSLLTSMNGLKNLSGVKLSSTLPNNLTKLVSALNTVPVSNTGAIQGLANSLTPLTQLGKTNLSSFITPLEKLPQILNNLDFQKFHSQIESLTRILKPFAAEMSAISAGFNSLPTRVQNLVRSTEKYNGVIQSSYKNTGLFNSSIVRMAASYISFQRIFQGIGSVIKASNAYQENLNLFTASMGEYTEEAMAYAEQVSVIMGIDISDWIRNQGIFQTLATGFGVANDQAAIMSKNLTQLGYDISSFYNITVADSMQKLQSAISGRICLFVGKLTNVICLIRGNSFVKRQSRAKTTLCGNV